MYSDTIFALSTIFGKSGVAVIRISGPEAIKVFSCFKITRDIKPRVATVITLQDNEGFDIDNCVIVWFKGPHSFTGEDVVEIQCHGSKAVINCILKELGKIFHSAKPGEFAQRAFNNNKLDLTSAEGLADLIEAETTMQARQALKQMNGNLKRVYDSWRKNLIEVIAQIEAYIDFPDEDIPQEILLNVEQQVQNMINTMEHHLHDDRRGEKLRNGFYISIIGPPNAGKSSLFNYLVQQDMAIISNIPGTTRDVLAASVDLDGYPVTIFDTAGIHNTLDPIEIEGILRAKEKIKESDLILALFPIDKAPYLDEKTKALANDRTIYIASKADHVKEDTEIYIENHKLLPISINNNVGLTTLFTTIKENVYSSLSASEAPVITRTRHRNAIKIAIQYLSRYNQTDDLILAAEELRMAAKTLGEITGHVKIDDVLGELFSTFCIGK